MVIQQYSQIYLYLNLINLLTYQHTKIFKLAFERFFRSTASCLNKIAFNFFTFTQNINLIPQIEFFTSKIHNKYIVQLYINSLVLSLSWNQPKISGKVRTFFWMHLRAFSNDVEDNLNKWKRSTYDVLIWYCNGKSIFASQRLVSLFFYISVYFWVNILGKFLSNTSI